MNATKLGTHNKVTKFRNYTKISAAVFKKEPLANDCVTDVDWQYAHMLPGKWQAFKNAFIAASDKCAPFQMRRLKNRNNPCVDDNLVKMMYKRDHLKRNAIKLKDESLWLLVSKQETVSLTLLDHRKEGVMKLVLTVTKVTLQTYGRC